MISIYPVLAFVLGFFFGLVSLRFLVRRVLNISSQTIDEFFKDERLLAVSDFVEQFHSATDTPIKKTAGLDVPAERRELRVKLLTEEFFEYLTAEKEDDLVEISDALCDLIYIACGTALEYGIPLEECMAEVCESNEEKIVDGYVLRREDGKIIKPEGWVAPTKRIEKVLLDNDWQQGLKLNQEVLMPLKKSINETLACAHD